MATIYHRDPEDRVPLTARDWGCIVLAVALAALVSWTAYMSDANRHGMPDAPNPSSGSPAR